jgi:hypothetical protein
MKVRVSTAICVIASVVGVGCADGSSQTADSHTGVAYSPLSASVPSSVSAPLPTLFDMDAAVLQPPDNSHGPAQRPVLGAPMPSGVPIVSGFLSVSPNGRRDQ